MGCLQRYQHEQYVYSRDKLQHAIGEVGCLQCDKHVRYVCYCYDIQRVSWSDSGHHIRTGHHSSTIRTAFVRVCGLKQQDYDSM
jgi:hypothetical protein